MTEISSKQDLDLSVVIIAFNEEANLARCLQSLPSGCETIVVDSGSHDQTLSIAKNFGARTFERAFTDFAEQKNYAIEQASRRWILSIDADEELSSALVEFLRKTCNAKNRQTAIAYRLRRRLVFMGRKMRWGKTEDAPIRLFLRGEGRFLGAIHERLELGATKIVKVSQGQIWHYSFRDLSDYFQRFNRYTSAIAEQRLAQGKRPAMLGHLLRPWLEFVGRYFFRLGFLDGYPGYTYALVSSLYAYIKCAKVVEQLAPFTTEKGKPS
ncbi:MAG: glycosyltransferase family 2 protein [Oligoflexus sp.]